MTSTIENSKEFSTTKFNSNWASELGHTGCRGHNHKNPNP
jgi:hypothetical protein